MAKSSLLSKVLSFIKGTINKIPSFFRDFEVTRADAGIEGSQYWCKREMISTNPISVRNTQVDLIVELAATNVDQVEAIKYCKKALDNALAAGQYNPNDHYQDFGIDVLLGEVTEDQVWSKNAQPDSMLNPTLDEKMTKLPSFWQDVANQLSYNLRCECKGYPQGEISNVSLPEIVNLLSSFLIKCGAVSAENTQAAQDAFRVNPNYLVLPILMLIQDYLKQYLDSVSSAIYGKEAPEGSAESTNSEPEDTAENTQPPESSADNTNTQTGGTNVNESKKINIKLQKITATSDINLLGIQADYNPGEALDVVDDILSNPEFTNLLTETPQTYEVCVDDEGYDINPCDELIVHPEENLKQLFIQAIQFSRNLHMIHWLAIGNDMEKLHIKAEELYGELDQEIDLLAELIVEKTGTITDINKIETWDTVGTQDRTFQQGIECIKQYAQSFIDYIDITYPNQPSDVQSILDDWLRYWNKQINYFIIREQEN